MTAKRLSNAWIILQIPGGLYRSLGCFLFFISMRICYTGCDRNTCYIQNYHLVLLVERDNFFQIPTVKNLSVFVVERFIQYWWICNSPRERERDRQTDRDRDRIVLIESYFGIVLIQIEFSACISIDFIHGTAKFHCNLKWTRIYPCVAITISLLVKKLFNCEHTVYTGPNHVRNWLYQ